MMTLKPIISRWVHDVTFMTSRLIVGMETMTVVASSVTSMLLKRICVVVLLFLKGIRGIVVIFLRDTSVGVPVFVNIASRKPLGSLNRARRINSTLFLLSWTHKFDWERCLRWASIDPIAFVANPIGPSNSLGADKHPAVHILGPEISRRGRRDGAALFPLLEPDIVESRGHIEPKIAPVKGKVSPVALEVLGRQFGFGGNVPQHSHKIQEAIGHALESRDAGADGHDALQLAFERFCFCVAAPYIRGLLPQQMDRVIVLQPAVDKRLTAVANGHRVEERRGRRRRSARLPDGGGFKKVHVRRPRRPVISETDGRRDLTAHGGDKHPAFGTARVDGVLEQCVSVHVAALQDLLDRLLQLFVVVPAL